MRGGGGMSGGVAGTAVAHVLDVGVVGVVIGVVRAISRGQGQQHRHANNVFELK